MFWGKKALNPYKKYLKNSKTTLKIHYTFTYCLKMKTFITGPCLLVNFVGLRLGFDVPEQIAPLRRCPPVSGSSVQISLALCPAHLHRP